jgi:hypothetical protein
MTTDEGIAAIEWRVDMDENKYRLQMYEYEW